MPKKQAKPTDLHPESVEKKSQHHFYIFTQNAGTLDSARTQAYREVELLLGDDYATSLDLLVVDEEAQSVDQLREVCSWLGLRSHSGQPRVCVFEAADLLSFQGQNLLLKTLEEAPHHAVVMMIAHTDRLLPTVLSRAWIVRVVAGRLGQEMFSAEVVRLATLRELAFPDVYRYISMLQEKDKSEILKIIEQAIILLRNSSDNQAQHSIFLRTLFDTYGRLQKNQNIKLVLHQLI